SDLNGHRTASSWIAGSLRCLPKARDPVKAVLVSTRHRRDSRWRRSHFGAESRCLCWDRQEIDREGVCRPQRCPLGSRCERSAVRDRVVARRADPPDLARAATRSRRDEVEAFRKEAEEQLADVARALSRAGGGEP